MCVLFLNALIEDVAKEKLSLVPSSLCLMAPL